MLYFSRAQVAALALAVLALLGGVAVVCYQKGYRDAPQFFTESPLAAGPTEVVVHVAGAVSHPGVYHLPNGARAYDAVAAAGGASPDADGDALNLAATLLDGQRLFIPARERSAAGPASAPAPTRPRDRDVRLSLNSATPEQLQNLPGVGPALAARIIAQRDHLRAQGQSGYTEVNQLLLVPGIGPKTFEALRPLVRL